MSIETATIEAVYSPRGLRGLDACDYCGHPVAANIVKVDNLGPGWVEVKADNIREPRLVFDGEAVFCGECYLENQNNCITYADEKEA